MKGVDIYKDKQVLQISLRNNKEYTLLLKYQEKEKVVVLYPKISVQWAAIDLLCGILPTFYDAYTGSWNVYPDIDASFEK